MDALEEKLNQLIPGATIKEIRENPPERRFVVFGKSPIAPLRKSSDLSSGHTKAEAVARVESLFGTHR